MKNCQIVYYYTSLAVLIRLLEKGELTLYSSKTNEKPEQLFFLRKFLYTSKKLSKINPAKYNNLVTEISNQSKLQVCPFICLCLRGDDAKQWKENGNDGYGVCLGFRLSPFEKLFQNTTYPQVFDFEHNANFNGTNLLYKSLENYLSKDCNRENNDKENFIDLLLTKSLLFKRELTQENCLRFLKISSPFFKYPCSFLGKTFKIATTVKIKNCQELLAEIIIGQKSNVTPQQLKISYPLEQITISKL